MLWMGSSAKLFAASAERDSRNGMTAVRGELRRNSWNIFRYFSIFPLRETAFLAFLYFCLVKMFHQTLDFLLRQNFQIWGCQRSDKKLFCKCRNERIPVPLGSSPLALDLLANLQPPGAPTEGSVALAVASGSAFNCRRQVVRSKAIRGNQMAVWTSVSPLLVLSLSFQSSNVFNIWLNLAGDQREQK